MAKPLRREVTGYRVTVGCRPNRFEPRGASVELNHSSWPYALWLNPTESEELARVLLDAAADGRRLIRWEEEQ